MEFRILPICMIVILSMSGCTGFGPFSRQRFDAAPASVPVAPLVSAPSPPAASQAPLILGECINVARRSNPTLASGSWDIQTALAQRDQAASEGYPHVNNVDSFRKYLQNQRLHQARINAEPGMFATGVLSADLVLRMPIFTGGRIRSEINAAEFLALAAENRLARTWEELIYNISSAFYTILGQRKLIESLEFSRSVLTRHQKRVQQMMAADKAARVDVLRTEVRIADLDQRLVRERTVLEIQRRILSTLMGIGGDGGPVDIRGDLQLSGPVPELNGALAMAYAERGDHRAARAALDAQAMKLNAVRGAQWPKVTLEGSVGLRTATGIDDNGVAFTKRLNWPNFPDPTLNFNRTPLRGPWPNPDSNLPVGNIGVVVDYPIFDGGKISSQIREQEARLAAAQQQLRKLELQIRLDVEIALLNVSSARQRVQATQKAIEQSKESFRIEQEKYDLGKGSITDVLDAQSAMLDAQTNYYRALAEFNIARAQLGLATGEKR